MPKKPDLTSDEKQRLYNALELLTTTLEWPVAKLTEHLGYSSTNSIYPLLKREGSVGRDRFQQIMKLVENCTLPSEVEKEKEKEEATALTLVPVTSAEARNGVGRRFRSLVDAPIERRVNQGIPVFVYLQSARDQLDEVVVTLDDALEHASNVLTAPGIKRLKGWVEDFQGQLDEALAMR